MAKANETVEVFKQLPDEAVDASTSVKHNRFR
jgi:hypothetical protein